MRRMTLIGEIDAREALDQSSDPYAELHYVDEEDCDMSPDEEALAESLADQCAQFETWLTSHVVGHCPFLNESTPQDLTICFPSTLDEVAMEKSATVFRPFDSRALVALVPLEACPDRRHLDYWLLDQNSNHFGMWVTAFHPERLANLGIPLFRDDVIILLIQDMEALELANQTLRKQDPNYYATPMACGPREDERLLAAMESERRRESLALWRQLSGNAPLTLFSRLHDGTAKHLVDGEPN